MLIESVSKYRVKEKSDIVAINSVSLIKVGNIITEKDCLVVSGDRVVFIGSSLLTFRCNAEVNSNNKIFAVHLRNEGNKEIVRETQFEKNLHTDKDDKNDKNSMSSNIYKIPSFVSNKDDSKEIKGWVDCKEEIVANHTEDIEKERHNSRTCLGSVSQFKCSTTFKQDCAQDQNHARTVACQKNIQHYSCKSINSSDKNAEYLEKILYRDISEKLNKLKSIEKIVSPIKYYSDKESLYKIIDEIAEQDHSFNYVGTKKPDSLLSYSGKVATFSSLFPCSNISIRTRNSTFKYFLYELNNKDKTILETLREIESNCGDITEVTVIKQKDTDNSAFNQNHFVKPDIGVNTWVEEDCFRIPQPINELIHESLKEELKIDIKEQSKNLKELSDDITQKFSMKKNAADGRGRTPDKTSKNKEEIQYSIYKESTEIRNSIGPSLESKEDILTNVFQSQSQNSDFSDYRGYNSIDMCNLKSIDCDSKIITNNNHKDYLSDFSPLDFHILSDKDEDVNKYIVICSDGILQVKLKHLINVINESEEPSSAHGQNKKENLTSIKNNFLEIEEKIYDYTNKDSYSALVEEFIKTSYDSHLSYVKYGLVSNTDTLYLVMYKLNNICTVFVTRALYDYTKLFGIINNLEKNIESNCNDHSFITITKAPMVGVYSSELDSYDEKQSKCDCPDLISMDSQMLNSNMNSNSISSIINDEGKDNSCFAYSRNSNDISDFNNKFKLAEVNRMDTPIVEGKISGSIGGKSKAEMLIRNVLSVPFFENAASKITINGLTLNHCISLRSVNAYKLADLIKKYSHISVEESEMAFFYLQKALEDLKPMEYPGLIISFMNRRLAYLLEVPIPFIAVLSKDFLNSSTDLCTKNLIFHINPKVSKSIIVNKNTKKKLKSNFNTKKKSKKIQRGMIVEIKRKSALKKQMQKILQIKLNFNRFPLLYHSSNMIEKLFLNKGGTSYGYYRTDIRIDFKALRSCDYNKKFEKSDKEYKLHSSLLTPNDNSKNENDTKSAPGYKKSDINCTKENKDDYEEADIIELNKGHKYIVSDATNQVENSTVESLSNSTNVEIDNKINRQLIREKCLDIIKFEPHEQTSNCCSSYRNGELESSLKKNPTKYSILNKDYSLFESNKQGVQSKGDDSCNKGSVDKIYPNTVITYPVGYTRINLQDALSIWLFLFQGGIDHNRIFSIRKLNNEILAQKFCISKDIEGLNKLKRRIFIESKTEKKNPKSNIHTSGHTSKKSYRSIRTSLVIKRRLSSYLYFKSSFINTDKILQAIGNYEALNYLDNFKTDEKVFLVLFSESSEIEKNLLHCNKKDYNLDHRNRSLDRSIDLIKNNSNDCQISCPNSGTACRCNCISYKYITDKDVNNAYDPGSHKTFDSDKVAEDKHMIYFSSINQPATCRNCTRPFTLIEIDEILNNKELQRRFFNSTFITNFHFRNKIHKLITAEAIINCLSNNFINNQVIGSVLIYTRYYRLSLYCEIDLSHTAVSIRNSTQASLEEEVRTVYI